MVFLSSEPENIVQVSQNFAQVYSTSWCRAKIDYPDNPAKWNEVAVAKRVKPLVCTGMRYHLAQCNFLFMRNALNHIIIQCASEYVAKLSGPGADGEKS